MKISLVALEILTFRCEKMYSLYLLVFALSVQHDDKIA
jgi:hypothetical protein